MVGQAHLTIPVRIAAERNREYVLVKRDETQGGGWALGIREGSKQKPIEVEKDEKSRQEVDSDSDYSDSDVEEIAPPPPQVSRRTTDPELREHRRREVLEAIAARYAPKKAPRASLDIEPKLFGKSRAPGALPLFDPTEDDEEENEVVPSANDEALALALQQEELGSDEEEADLDLARALALSRKEAEGVSSASVREGSVDSIKSITSEDSFEEVSLDPSRVPTPQVLSQQPTPIVIDVDDEDDGDMIEVEGPLAQFTLPSAKVSKPPVPAKPPLQTKNGTSMPDKPLRELPKLAPRPGHGSADDQPHHVVSSPTDLTEIDRKLEAIRPEQPIRPRPTKQSDKATVREFPKPIVDVDVEDDFMEILPEPVKADKPVSPIQDSQAGSQRRDGAQSTAGPSTHRAVSAVGSATSKPVMDTRAPLPSVQSGQATAARPALSRSVSRLSHRASATRSISRTPAPEPEDPDNLSNSLLGIRATRPVDRHSYMEMAEESVPSSYQGSTYEGENGDKSDSDNGEDDDDEDAIEWSKSPSPTRVSRPPLQPAQSGETIPSEVEDEDEDMAPAEMVAEQDDYARFMASIRNRDLNEVRTEIDDEIRVLNNQNKVAMRDSDEITQAMVAQIQVCDISLAPRVLSLQQGADPLDPSAPLRYTVHHRTHGS
jgi:DNA excision repair protein ERCC-5